MSSISIARILAQTGDFIYFVKVRNLKFNLFKIGKTKSHPEIRLKSMESEIKRIHGLRNAKLELYEYRRLGCASFCESQLIKLLKPFRAKLNRKKGKIITTKRGYIRTREWFLIDDDIVDDILYHCIDQNFNHSKGFRLPLYKAIRQSNILMKSKIFVRHLDSIHDAG